MNPGGGAPPQAARVGVTAAHGRTKKATDLVRYPSDAFRGCRCRVSHPHMFISGLTRVRRPDGGRLTSPRRVDPHETVVMPEGTSACGTGVGDDVRCAERSGAQPLVFCLTQTPLAVRGAVPANLPALQAPFLKTEMSLWLSERLQFVQPIFFLAMRSVNFCAMA